MNAADLVRKKPVAAAVLDARERQQGWKYPPSFRRALAEHGLFTLGKVTPETAHLCFVVWPVKEHVTALALLADQLGCDADAAKVAEELGIPEKDAAALAHLVVIGAEGHEDFCAFDTRTRNPKTGECSFRLVLFDDLEIADAAKPGKRPNGDAFDAWISKHVKRRAREDRNDEPAPEKPTVAKPKSPKAPKPLESFAKLGAFSTVPRAHVEKRIQKLLAPKKLGKDIWWDEGEMPDVAFVHDGAIRGRDLKIGGSEPGIYVIEGDLSSAGYLNFDLDEDVIVLVAGDVKTTNLRISFATTLLVEGKLSADYVVSESLVHFAVAGVVKAKRIFVYDEDQRPKLGGKPKKGVVVPFRDLDDVVGDAHYHQAPDAPELFKKIIRGKKFLAGA